ncbi:MAG: dTMP kinase [Candidatus Bathyarchaeota archaeon]|jgi:dTMP kinase|nr:dTMP kinase [Candidatus Bathyarchaeota archaeon A05DMB-5]MDH7557198.1 dTMP kinase [Candidatus Bathyarchaeota archaeon]
MKGKGVFVCVEGLDGCGKTTQTKFLVRRLRKLGYDAVYTAEPTRGKIGNFIRKYCLHGSKRMSVVVEALLFAADRFEHVKDVILPTLDKGSVMVSDRYVYSSMAYQGAAGLDLKWIGMINKHALRPNLAIFIDVEPHTVIQRLKSKKSVMENLETQLKVREVYMQFVEKGELIRIDGNKSKKEVADAILEVVMKFLGEKA